MTKFDQDSYQAERLRQTEVFGAALNAALDECVRSTEKPILNAVLGAVVDLEIKLLASIPDGPTRKAVRKSMDKLLRTGLRDALRDPSSIKAKMIQIGGQS